MSLLNKSLIISSFLLLLSCGDSGNEKVSKGHRDAIKIQCENTSNVKACGLEVRENFIEDGNEYADFGELDDDQIDVVKFNCVRAKKYGLVAYNNCLHKLIAKAEGGDLFDDDELPADDHIASLERSTVYIEVSYANVEKKEELTFTSGSGVIISKNDIATNCHVAMHEDLEYLQKTTGWKRSDVEKIIWVKTVSGKDWAAAKIIKKNPKKDICIIRHMPVDQFKIEMKPIKTFTSFEKIRKGDFVRAMGSPGGLIGHTAEGSIQWLGTADGLTSMLGGTRIAEKFFDEYLDQDTKLIIHGAKIAGGSSGGPLFDDDGNIVGINTLSFPDSAAENVAISSDHIKDLLFNK